MAATLGRSLRLLPSVAEMQVISEIRATMTTRQQQFDPDATLSAVRAARAQVRRRRTWGKSRLVPHRAELVQLRRAGGSFADLVHWLRSEKRVKVARSTVARYLAQLPEFAGQHGCSDA
jgi:hypothetical protein